MMTLKNMARSSIIMLTVSLGTQSLPWTAPRALPALFAISHAWAGESNGEGGAAGGGVGSDASGGNSGAPGVGGGNSPGGSNGGSNGSNGGVGGANGAAGYGGFGGMADGGQTYGFGVSSPIGSLSPDAIPAYQIADNGFMAMIDLSHPAAPHPVFGPVSNPGITAAQLNLDQSGSGVAVGGKGFMPGKDPTAPQPAPWQ